MDDTWASATRSQVATKAVKMGGMLIVLTTRQGCRGRGGTLHERGTKECRMALIHALEEIAGRPADTAIPPVLVANEVASAKFH